MSLPTPTFIGQEETVEGKRYQVVSLDPPAWKGITTGTAAGRIAALESLVQGKVTLSYVAPMGTPLEVVLLAAESNPNIDEIVIDYDCTLTEDISTTKVLSFLNSAVITLEAELTLSKQPLQFGYRQIFNVTTGGAVLSPDHTLEFIEAYWFGTTPYDNSEAVAKNNMKAIKEALVFCSSLGIGSQSDGRTPVCYIPPFVTYLDLPDTHTDGVGAYINSYVPLRGRQFNNLLSVRPNAAAMDLFRINQDGANSVQIGNFQVDGNYQSQVNLQNFLKIDPASAPVIYSNIGEGTLYVKEMSGYGVFIGGAGLDNSNLNPYVIRDCGRNAVYCAACDKLEVYGRYRTSKTIYANILFDGSGVWSANLHGVNSREAGGAGLWVSNINTERGKVKVLGGDYEENGTSGLILDRAGTSSVENVNTHRNGDHGLDIVDCSGITYTGGRNEFNKKRGVNGTRVDSSIIGSGVRIDSNSDTNPNVYDGITLFTSDDNFIDGLMVRNKNATQRYGLAIDDAASSSNKLGTNDLRGSGNTGELSDGGTGTIGVSKVVSGTQTVAIPANGNTQFTITDSSVDTNDDVVQVESSQLSSVIYTTEVTSGAVTINLFNNTNTTINITNLNIDVFLVSGL